MAFAEKDKERRKVKMQGKYFININSRIIHNGESPCYSGEHMNEENKKWSDSFEELVFCLGGKKKGTACAVCCKERI